jgi:hypothetical protein
MARKLVIFILNLGDFDLRGYCHAALIEEAGGTKSRKIASMDCSFTTKSGKQSYGVDYYYKGSASKSQKGLTNFSILKQPLN